MSNKSDESAKTPAPTETRPGQQSDDNIDDLGRNVNDPKAKPVDQPVIKESKDPPA